MTRKERVVIGFLTVVAGLLGGAVFKQAELLADDEGEEACQFCWCHTSGTDKGKCNSLGSGKACGTKQGGTGGGCGGGKT